MSDSTTITMPKQVLLAVVDWVLGLMQGLWCILTLDLPMAP